MITLVTLRTKNVRQPAKWLFYAKFRVVTFTRPFCNHDHTAQYFQTHISIYCTHFTYSTLPDHEIARHVGSPTEHKLKTHYIIHVSNYVVLVAILMFQHGNPIPRPSAPDLETHLATQSHRVLSTHIVLYI